jgi:recombination protein RecA
LGQGRENVKNYLKEHPEIVAEIEQTLLEKAGIKKQTEATA